VTNNDEEATNESNTSSSKLLVLHPALQAYNSHTQYTTGVHFTPTMLKCPTKSINKEQCSGRFLLDLCKQTVANVKKACVVAEEWLLTHDKPSGNNWEDLYSNLIENNNKINPKEKVFTGFGNFICHTKYNNGGQNLLNFFEYK